MLVAAVWAAAAPPQRRLPLLGPFDQATAIFLVEEFMGIMMGSWFIECIVVCVRFRYV
jgi:hypothetical protein